MASNTDRAQRWMDRVLGRTDRDLGTNGNVFYDPRDLTIYSYGHHFPLAIPMTEQDGARWVLLNGDRYSVSTSRHQAIVRGVVRDAGLRHIIVPFSALNAAGIERESIEILEVRADRIERWTEEVEPSGAKVARLVRGADGLAIYEDDPNRRYVRGSNGAIAERYGPGHPWEVERTRHWLGDSIFRARSNGRRRRFLSSFDYQEAQPLYFLCELPRSSKATTVEQAYEDLKPQAVKDAEAAGLEPTRQGDMFAIPTELSTREVKLLTPHRKGRIVKRPKRGLLGTNHTASEVMFCTHGRVYARGLLYHEPGRWRDPDHARRKMGDGRTWHLLVKNTVPRAQANPRTREMA